MVNEALIRTWLKDVTYKPGWSVDYMGNVDGTDYISVHAAVPDVCIPGGTFHTSPLFAVPVTFAVFPDDTPLTVDQFFDWILDTCIPGVEQHERYEWFKVGGHHWRDPHAVGMPAFATDFK
jgi:hypothetical protein